MQADCHHRCLIIDGLMRDTPMSDSLTLDSLTRSRPMTLGHWAGPQSCTGVSGRHSSSTIEDAADGLKFIIGEVFEFSRQEVADLLYRNARAASNLATAEIGYGDEPCDDAHQAGTLFQIPDIKVRASSRRRFESVCS